MTFNHLQAMKGKCVTHTTQIDGYSKTRVCARLKSLNAYFLSAPTSFFRISSTGEFLGNAEFSFSLVNS